MRVGIFTDTYLPYVSGLVTSVLMLKTSLEEKGHEVYIVTANLENFKFIKDKENKIIKIPGLPIGIYDARLTGIYSFAAINEIRKWKLDIIHSQTEFGIGTFARIVSKQLDIPLVHTYHTLYEDYTYYITKGYFDKASKKFVEYLSKFYCDKTATGLIVPSRKIYNLFKDKYLVNKDIKIIGTGIDVDRFNKNNFTKKEINELKEKYKIDKDCFVIGTVSRIAKEKSIERIIYSFDEIRKNIDNTKLVIVGDGPQLDELKKLVKKLKLNNYVIFTGKVPITSVQLYYQLMDVFVTFSVTETQGLTVLEAMAASIPVLCINDASFIDSVINNKTGFVFEDEKEFIKDIYKIYNDKSLYNKLSENSYKHSQNFSSKEFGNKVFNVYVDTIKKYNECKTIKNIKDVIKPSKIIEIVTKGE